MRIVQSLWTKPFGNCTNDRFNGGWLSEKYNYISWALSSLLLKQHYESVHLVTDEAGARLLIDKLNLPYASVDTSLEHLNKYPVSLWALGKIWTYAIQSETFMHVDGDVFLWEPIKDEVISSKLFCQNLEIDASIYNSAFKILEDYNFKMTTPLLCRPTKITACNAGVIGGYSGLLWAKLWATVLEFIEGNLNIIASCEHAHILNLLLEQYLVHQLAAADGVEPSVVFESDMFQEEMSLMMPSEISRAIFDMNYTHLLGVSKKDRVKLMIMERLLDHFFPTKYHEILSLLN